jgi:hypothetical protein
VDAVCAASFNEVANNLNNNIVMLNKTYNITNKSEKIECTCFANVYFVMDLDLISIYCTQIHLCCYFVSVAELLLPHLPFCMQESIKAPR